MLDLRRRRYYNPLAVLVVERPTGPSEHLEEILHAERRPATQGGRVDLGVFYDDRVGRQVHAPGERGRGYEDGEVAGGKEVLDHLAVVTRQTGVMEPDTRADELAQLPVRDLRLHSFQDLPGSFGGEHFLDVLAKRHFLQLLGCSGGFFARMHENQNLVLLDSLNDFFEQNLLDQQHFLHPAAF